MNEPIDKVYKYHNGFVFKIDKIPNMNYIMFRCRNDYFRIILKKCDNNDILQNYDITSNIYIKEKKTFGILYNLVVILCNFDNYYKTKNKIIFHNGLEKINYSMRCDVFAIVFKGKTYKYDLFDLKPELDINTYEIIIHFLLKLIHYKIMCYVNDNSFIYDSKFIKYCRDYYASCNYNNIADNIIPYYLLSRHYYSKYCKKKDIYTNNYYNCYDILPHKCLCNKPVTFFHYNYSYKYLSKKVNDKKIFIFYEYDSDDE